MAQTIDLSVIPGVVTIANTGRRRLDVNISGMNQEFPLEAGDTLKMWATSSSELIGYLSQVTDDNGLVVTLPVAEVEEEEEEEEEEPETPPAGGGS